MVSFQSSHTCSPLRISGSTSPMNSSSFAASSSSTNLIHALSASANCMKISFAFSLFLNLLSIRTVDWPQRPPAELSRFRLARAARMLSSSACMEHVRMVCGLFQPPRAHGSFRFVPLSSVVNGRRKPASFKTSCRAVETLPDRTLIAAPGGDRLRRTCNHPQSTAPP